MKVISSFSYSLLQSFFICDNGPSSSATVLLRLLFGPSSRKTKIGHVLLKKMPSSFPTRLLFLPFPPLSTCSTLFPPSSPTFPSTLPLPSLPSSLPFFSLHSLLRSFHTTPNQHIDTPNIKWRYNIYRTKYKPKTNFFFRVPGSSGPISVWVWLLVNTPDQKLDPAVPLVPETSLLPWISPPLVRVQKYGQ